MDAQLFHTVAEVIRTQLVEPDKDIVPSEKVKDLGMDSLDLVDTLNTVEDRTGIVVPSNMLGKLIAGTVKELVDYLEGRKTSE